jgi:acetyltransferase-like isoleucine patch superfamily enzyme
MRPLDRLVSRLYWSIHNRVKGTYVASRNVSWKTSIGKHCWIREGAEIRGKVIIGDHSYIIGPNTFVDEAVIGKFCSIARNVIIGPPDHDYHCVSTHPFIYSAFYRFIESDRPASQKRVPIIGHDVWIGMNSVVLRGVTVGHGAVIGAGAVVTHDVEPYSIVAGVPARHVKYRFPGPIREALLEIKWWDWDEDRLRDAIPSFYDVGEFVRRHDARIPATAADECDRCVVNDTGSPVARRHTVA